MELACEIAPELSSGEEPLWHLLIHHVPWNFELLPPMKEFQSLLEVGWTLVNDIGIPLAVTEKGGIGLTTKRATTIEVGWHNGASENATDFN